MFGLDYLGEPYPYDTDAWPSRSSMFGIIDLANLPKDRYYLYRSVWNKHSNILHIVLHWTFPNREGEKTPIMVYTNHHSAELFVNEKSYGKRYKIKTDTLRRFRLIWENVIYEPGELKVIAYNNLGKAIGEKVVYTAEKPHHTELINHEPKLIADGKSLAYITVRIVDKKDFMS